MSETDEPVSLRSMIEVVEKQRNPGQRLKNNDKKNNRIFESS